jgi:dihydroorotate dehydrogenase
MGLYRLARPLLFALPPERAHAVTLRTLRLAGLVPPLRALLRAVSRPVRDPVELLGLRFPNRVGLAAGYDKDALAVAGLAALGFGHVEIGTVTPRPQPGNPRPRLFRLVEDRAVINRLGFPGQGTERVAARLRRRPTGIVVGVNLGKQRDTPLEGALEDYLGLLERFAPLADYLTVNVSSPNTPGLRRLEAGEELARLASALVARRDALAAAGRRVPLLVKLSPDLADEELDESVDALASAGIDGVVVTNTTLSREGLRSPFAREAGGLSGAPLAARAQDVAARTARRAAGRLVVVGAGGIDSAAAAAARRAAGASLLQLYTGLVYRGPALVRQAAAAAAAQPPP